MARLDFYSNPDLPGYILDCQNDLLSGLSTRLTVPLMPPEHAPLPAGRLNPTFQIDGQPVIMVTQFAAAIPAQQLRDSVGSLADQDFVIGNAIDLLLGGV